MCCLGDREIGDQDIWRTGEFGYRKMGDWRSEDQVLGDRGSGISGSEERDGVIVTVIELFHDDLLMPYTAIV